LRVNLFLLEPMLQSATRGHACQTVMGEEHLAGAKEAATMFRGTSIGLRALIATTAILTMAGGLACSGSSSIGDYEFTSTVDSGHAHQIGLFNADIENPPEEKIIETTSVSGHTHTITLNRADYEAFKSGQQINVTTSVADGHTHAFRLGKIIVGGDTGP